MPDRDLAAQDRIGRLSASDTVSSTVNFDPLASK